MTDNISIVSPQIGTDSDPYPPSKLPAGRRMLGLCYNVNKDGTFVRRSNGQIFVDIFSSHEYTHETFNSIVREPYSCIRGFISFVSYQPRWQKLDDLLFQNVEETSWC